MSEKDNDSEAEVQREAARAAQMLDAQALWLQQQGIDVAGHRVSLMIEVGEGRGAMMCMDCAADLMLVRHGNGYQFLQHVNGAQWQAAQACPGRTLALEPEPDKGRF